MATLAQRPAVVQAVLGTVAAQAAHHRGGVHRHRPGKVGGAPLVHTLVLGWRTDPAASLAALCRAAARLGVAVPPQARDQRVTPAVATGLRPVVEAALAQVVSAAPARLPLRQRCTGVSLLDSTTITLPAARADGWQGGGGRVPQGSAAARKRQVCLDLRAGTLSGSLHDGRTQHQTAPELTAARPAGALRLQDLGSCKWERWAAWAAAGVV